MKKRTRKLYKAFGIALTAAMLAGSVPALVMAQDNSAPEIDTSRTTTQSGEKYDKTAIGLISDPKDLAPESLGGDNSQLYVFYNVYETLFDYRNDEYVPILAKGYTEVDDLHWQVELYDYIYDTEGNNITADDVVFSIYTLVDAGAALKYDKFDSVKKVDDYTVEFTWTSPIDGLGDLEWPWCRTCIFSQKAYENGNFHDAPVATGPYKVTDFVVGSKVMMEANDNYWQKEELTDPEHKANVQTVEYDIIAETSQHVIALSTGQIQYSEYVPAENLADFQEGGQYQDENDVYISQGSALYVLMGNNSQDSLMNDVNLRKAVFYAIDNNAIAAATGTCMPAKAFGTSFFGDYDPAWEEAENNYMAVCDMDKAKEYLSQSGYNGENLKLLSTSDEVAKNMMTMIQALLLNVGINVEIVAEEEALAQSDAMDSTKWDLFITKAGGGNQIGEWNRTVNYNEFGTGYNMAFIKDDTLQEHLTTCKSLEGHTQENMTAMHDYILENAYYYALATSQINAVYSEDFASLVYRESEFLRPGACEYYLD